MQNRIAYYIVSLLYLNGKVRVPGIGQITHRYHQAAVHDEGLLLAPPQSMSLFEQDRRSKNRLLEKFIAYRSQVSRTKARREIARFSSQVKADIQAAGSAELKYLGTLSLQDDEILFSPNEAILNPGHSSLKAIRLPRHLEKFIEEESLPHAVNDRHLPEIGAVVMDDIASPHEDSIQESLISTPAPSIEEAIAVEELLDLPMQAEPQVAYHEHVEELPIVEEERVLPPVTIIHPDKIEVVVTPLIDVTSSQPSAPIVTPKATKTPSTKKKDGEVPIAVPAIALLLIGLLVAAFLFYQSRTSHPDTVIINDTTTIPTIIDEPSSSTSDQIAVDDSQSSSSENDQVDVVASEPPSETNDETKVALADTGTQQEAENTPITEEPAKVTSESPFTVNAEFHIATGDCAIVLGAFSMSDNADRMVTRLQKMGYHAYTQPRAGLTQVGIRADCNAKNLQVVLGFLRKNVEPHAWVMRPN